MEGLLLQFALIRPKPAVFRMALMAEKALLKATSGLPARLLHAENGSYGIDLTFEVFHRPIRAMEKVALESKSRRGSGGSYEFFKVWLTKA